MKKKGKWTSSNPPPNPAIFVDYIKDEGLAKLIEGKTIAFVGPSPHLSGSGSGKLIDSYDIVIRPGQLIKVPEERVKDIGSRTDIITHSFNIYERAETLKHLDFIKSLKYIICSMTTTTDAPALTRFFPLLKTPVHDVDDGYMFKLFSEVGTCLNSGFAGLLTIALNYNVKEIYVTGFSFYNMGKFGDIYFDEYMGVVQNSGIMKNSPKKQISPQDARADLHNQDRQIEYFRDFVKENPELIKIDQYLKENL